MSNSDRKASFKALPAAVRDPLTAQGQRRNKALEEQKRRRAERIDSTRQLDFFADLTLGPSDDEADDDGGTQNGPDVVREGISQFATMLPRTATAVPAAAGEPAASPPQAGDAQTKGKKRGKGQRKAKARASAAASAHPKGQRSGKPNKWADKCMYAELLEMTEEYDGADLERDGIPDDIETSWVAVTPVPRGKRCLAVTHQATGIAGVVPNTTLRSRVLGKALMKPFPSPLPPQTVLDCILDENWHDNGLLHVLDVLQWKAQDVADCDAPFRFWWRDTRLSELPSFPPPASAAPPGETYAFPHPTALLPVPYHTNTTLANLANMLIPVTRAPRRVAVTTPRAPDGGPVQLQATPAEIAPDGLLLYVAQATYEPGTSPLSSWLPLRAYDVRGEGVTDVAPVGADSPLDVFERLIARRLARVGADGLHEVSMDVGS
ncbi:hypothetical protein B0H21DRAFT_878266 [Amylocystis lapponica]|nr:hypothetical protein B0H21DRAFT_878266 [Amylocystis lapponica]